MRIAHINYNVKQNKNIGDEAHVLAIQDTLRDIEPNIEFIDLSIYTIAKYHVPKIIPHGVKYPLFLHDICRELKGIGKGKIKKIIDRCDLVVVGGGGLYINTLLPFDDDFISSLKRPIVVYGVGYNENLGSASLMEESLGSIRAIGDKAKLHSVRDVNTQEYLNTLGVTTELIGDPAMFMSRKDITPNKSLGKVLHIGINIAAHGWHNSDKYIPSIVETYAKVLKKLSEQRTVELIYFQHYDREQEVIDVLKAKGIPIKKVAHSDARTVNKAYKEVDFTISMMLHSSILAFGNIVPVVCVGYDAKNKAFMELTGQSDTYIPVEQLTGDLLQQKIDLMISTYRERVQGMYVRYKELDEKSQDFARRVIKLISNDK